MGRIYTIIINILFGQSILIRALQQHFVLKYLNLRKTSQVLDIGCGSGNFTKIITKHTNKHIYAIDRNVTDNINTKGVTWVKGEAESLPFVDSYFDRILISSVLQMVPNPNIILQEASRVLKNNGVITVTFPVEYSHLIKKCGEEAQMLHDKIDKYWEGMNGNGRFTFNQFNRILEDNSLEFIDYEYSPKKYASFIIENLMWYRMRRKKTYLIHSLDILLYPVLFIDKYLPKKSKGLDLVCALRKKNRYYDNVIR